MTGPETNRETLTRIVRELQSVADDDAITPTPFDAIYGAIRSLNDALRFPLDQTEAVAIREVVA